MTPHHWEHSRPTHVPTRVRQAALRRDGGQCTAFMRDGTRCTETTKLEAHEHTRWFEGKTVRLEDVTMLCHWHHNRITQAQAQAARRTNNQPPPRQHPGLK